MSKDEKYLSPPKGMDKLDYILALRAEKAVAEKAKRGEFISITDEAVNQKIKFKNQLRINQMKKYNW